MPSAVRIDIFDQSLNKLAIVENASEVVFTRQWFSIGEFSIKINANIDQASYFVKRNIIMIDNDPYRSGIITKTVRSIDEQGKGNEFVTATGYELKYLFKQRIIRQLNNKTLEYIKADGESVIKTEVSRQCGAQCTDSNRVFSMLSIATNQTRGDTYTLNCKYTNLADELSTAALQSGVGWFVYLDLTNKKYILDCGLGTDRSASCIFSPDFDSLRKADLTDSVESLCNLVYVGGSGSGSSRLFFKGYDTTEPTGLDRFEAFDDESSLDTATELNAQAVAFLAQYNQTLSIDASSLQYSPFVLRTDYNVGDAVGVRYGGVDFTTQITGVEESWQNGKYEITLTYGKQAATIGGQLSSVASSASTSASTSESGTNANTMCNPVLSIDVTSAGYTQAVDETLYNVIEITGTMTAARTVNLYFDSTTLKGRKAYLVVLKAWGYRVNLATASGPKYTSMFRSSESAAYPTMLVEVDSNGSVSGGTDLSTVFGLPLNFGATSTTELTTSIISTLDQVGDMGVFAVGTTGNPEPINRYMATLVGISSSGARLFQAVTSSYFYRGIAGATDTSITWTRILDSQYIGTNWSTALGSALGAGWTTAMASALGTNWATALGSALGSGWATAMGAALGTNWSTALGSALGSGWTDRLAASGYLGPNQQTPLAIDVSSAGYTQAVGETVYDTIEITGAMTANRTVTLYLSSTVGRKCYTVIMKATTATVGYGVTFATASGTISKKLPANYGSETYATYQVYVDASGNVHTTQDIEYGANSNGSYWKFGNGLLICTGVSSSVTTATANGNVFANGVAFTFPYQFANTDYKLGAYAQSTVNGVWAGAANITRTTSGISSMYIFGPTSSSTGYLEYIAIGVWK